MKGLGGIFGESWDYRACNEGTVLLKNFNRKYRKEDPNGTPCNLWMTEYSTYLHPGGHKEYQHAYTVVRAPQEHVLSQYFHCKESKDHAKYAYKMPSLDEWLDHHMIRLVNKTLPAEYHCYDPINLQSRMTGFEDSMSESDLRERFDIIGDMKQLGKSVCAILVKYTGVVPPQCDCTNALQNRRRLFDHGVQHHGATFNVSTDQAAKISKLTTLDSVLYDRVKAAFDNQVDEIEQEFEIMLCQHPQW
eukprot:2064486-Ditylum_brightwellii.AAC.1